MTYKQVYFNDYTFKMQTKFWDKIATPRSNVIVKQGYFGITGPCKGKIVHF